MQYTRTFSTSVNEDRANYYKFKYSELITKREEAIDEILKNIAYNICNKFLQDIEFVSYSNPKYSVKMLNEITIDAKIKNIPIKVDINNDILVFDSCIYDSKSNKFPCGNGHNLPTRTKLVMEDSCNPENFNNIKQYMKSEYENQYRKLENLDMVIKDKHIHIIMTIISRLIREYYPMFNGTHMDDYSNHFITGISFDATTEKTNIITKISINKYAMEFRFYCNKKYIDEKNSTDEQKQFIESIKKVQIPDLKGYMTTMYEELCNN